MKDADHPMIKSKRDINDLTEMRSLTRSLGSLGLSVKLLHNIEVDHITINPGEKYGNTRLESPILGLVSHELY
ncbi:Uu.00g136330.m01.CDS01 [Anthostomella pinea]|uniref:Uu.00g136330.m01.CDS01 n=1 Tax=Anthostomella pinea TaxID=933095 RepID=A0AAI8VQ86_9PEZI|nr:Uu.00g136330.m01.CDS01 [Anthostomella pinea]